MSAMFLNVMLLTAMCFIVGVCSRDVNCRDEQNQDMVDDQDQLVDDEADILEEPGNDYEPYENDEEVGESNSVLLEAGLFEGDIANVNASDIDGRNSINRAYLKWPNGVIPYGIAKGHFSSSDQQRIRNGIQQYHSLTCLKFVPRKTETDYVIIRSESGCFSSVGRQGGRQTVSLGRGCLSTGIVVHELMHAAGFWHEQSRPDRDNYVTINYQNIQRGMESNFQKFSHGEVDTLNLPYDLGSVMHYGMHDFSSNGRPTVIPKTSGTRIGQRDGFSSLDLQKVNKLYHCTNQGKRDID